MPERQGGVGHDGGNKIGNEWPQTMSDATRRPLTAANVSDGKLPSARMAPSNLKTADPKGFASSNLALSAITGNKGGYVSSPNHAANDH